MLSCDAKSTVVKVNMGQIRYGRPSVILETVLGSCVGIALWDRETRHAGLAHVMLPYRCGTSTQWGKLADTATSQLCRQMVEGGAALTRLSAKLVGGACMFGPDTREHLGRRNHQAARECLAKMGIRIAAEYVGGTTGCMMSFAARDGSICVAVHGKPATSL